MTEKELLTAARAGDEDAFGSLVSEHRKGLFGHCYRMLGSPHDAEDALQEALLRAWRGLPEFEGRSSLRTWLYTIATNTSLRAIERRPTRVLPIDYGDPASDPHGVLDAPLTESVWVQPVPDSALAYEDRESVELAFVAALQLLPARQRAVLILRDVLGFSGGEVAAALETSESAVYSALQRAHATIDARLPDRSQQATMQDLGDEALRELVASFVDAWERADVDAIAALLTDDAVISMPPMPTWFRGREAVVDFLAGRPLDGTILWPTMPVGANGQLAFGHWRDDGGGSVTPHGITILELDGDRISSIIAYLDAGLFELFGLPDAPPLNAG